MVAEIQNTTATFLRGTASNQFGDTIDAPVPLATGVPVFLCETGKTIQDPASPTPRTIRQIICHAPAYLGLVNTDRTVDETTTNMYIIIGVTRPSTMTGAPVDVVLDLKRISAQTT